MILQDIPSKPGLSEFVRKYEVFRFVFENNVVPPPKYHVPRAEHCITFYVRDAQKFSFATLPHIIAYPQCIINGIHNVPIYRYGSHDFWAVKVILQPSALYLLTGIPSYELTNTFIDAEAVWGKEVRHVCQQLNSTDSLKEMLEHIEKFLEHIIKKSPQDWRPIDKVGTLILQPNHGLSIDKLADQSCLSRRQFFRKFEERIGVSPKMFDRINRFEKSFRTKNKHPDWDWLTIALACGYYDYQHLVKDYKDFTNLTPTAFYETDRQAPERVFGIVET
ncbi:helix-turn-helix domain-containing protein [Runella aurantiaca]|uniref:AraC family transcriptional regulator n=1 Tax=Runella aurantiaca TaxID=2282308 RepID=A0A369I8P0_9BACT|nr:AraC family transcriptional regulator [Runella aurantiaca]RDB05968.1 AraC family transcriptional regulator [Runella aurantiaca]